MDGCQAKITISSGLTHISPLYVALPLEKGFGLVLKQRSPVCQVKQSNSNKERGQAIERFARFGPQALSSSRKECA